MTDKQVLNIKVKMVKVGIKNIDIANYFGVSNQAISLVFKGDKYMKSLTQKVLELFDKKESELIAIFKKGN